MPYTSPSSCRIVNRTFQIKTVNSPRFRLDEQRCGDETFVSDDDYIQRNMIMNERHSSNPNLVRRIDQNALFLGIIVLTSWSFGALAAENPADQRNLGILNTLSNIDPRYFISGGLCAAASHGVTTPVDVVKTRMQAEPDVYKNGGLFKATQNIIQKDGIGVLSGGLGPTLVGYGAEGAAKFGLYESLKPYVANSLHLNDLTIPYLIASAIAGAAASLILCPMEKTRIRLVTDPTFAEGLITGVSKLIEEQGFISIFSGMPAMLSKQVPYTVTKQVSFDVLAGLLYGVAVNLNFSATDIKLEVSLGAAFLASILSCIASQPGDVILTNTYKNKGDGVLSFQEVVSSIRDNQGLNGFFAGISARFLHVGAIITFQLVLYDYIKQMLGLPATGTH